MIARDIIMKNKMSYLREKLAADTRFRLPMAEFEEWLELNEVPREEGINFLKALHIAGLVLYYPYRAPNWVYLRPRAITRELLHKLDPDGSLAASLMRNKTANLAKLEEEYLQLSELKAGYDAQALAKGNRWTKIMMGSVIAQILIMGRLIFWDLSWDIMEPVSYLLAFTYMTFGWAYYTINKDDIAEYGTIAGRLVSSQEQKIYLKNNFSVEKYNQVSEEILQAKATLKSYGVVTVADKKQYPISMNSPEAVAATNELLQDENIAAAKN
jgi:hypothetical protein